MPRDESTELPAGHIIAGRYEIEACLGSGGMGSVYSARDSVLNGEKVAIKVLHPDLIADQKQTQRFLREVQLMRRVSHKNVVRTFDVGSDINDVVYFTMEFVPGRPLEDFIQEQNFPRDSLAMLIIQVCEGLDAIHKAGIIHRDLKPANIMVLQDGSIKITDFGVARPEYSDLTAHNEIIGSALYIAPEIWLGTKLTGSVDLYSLGVLLYELTTGILPFDGDSPAALMRMHLEFEPPAPKDLNASLPPWLNKLILNLLRKSAAERPRDAREVIEYVRMQIQAPEKGDAESGDFMNRLEELNRRAAPRQQESASGQKTPIQRSNAKGTIRERGRGAGRGRVAQPAKSAGEAIIARTICFLAAFLLFWGLPLLIDFVSARNSVNAYDRILAAGSVPAFSAVGYAAIRFFPLFFRAVLPLALVAASSGSLLQLLRTVFRAFCFASGCFVILFIGHIIPALKQGPPNSLSLVSAGYAAADHLSTVMAFDVLVTKIQSIALPIGLVVSPVALGYLWAEPVCFVLAGLYSLFIAFSVKCILGAFDGDSRIAAVAVLCLFLLGIVVSPVFTLDRGAVPLFPIRGLFRTMNTPALSYALWGITCTIVGALSFLWSKRSQ